MTRTERREEGGWAVEGSCVGGATRDDEEELSEGGTVIFILYVCVIEMCVVRNA